MRQDGGCLCGDLRYRVSADPLWVTICHCRFCQTATGALGMVEPIFDIDTFRMVRGEPRVYEHISGGSGKTVNVHFCARCGTKTHLTFERWADRLGIYGGTFDDPAWFEMSPATSKIIFVDMARPGTLIAPGYPTFHQHAAEPDGTPCVPMELDEVLHIRRRLGMTATLV